jgi:glycoside hydrolase-like protein
MSAWLAPASPYRWVGYYLAAPCHRDASWMGKRATLNSMGWGFAVIYVGQQTFEGIPFKDAPFDRSLAVRADSLAPARAGIMVPPTSAELANATVVCSRTLLSAEQGVTDAIDAATKAASEGFPNGTVIYLDIEPMTVIPSSMEAYYRAWLGQVIADGRFRPGVYVAKANAAAIYDGARQVYADMHADGSALFWVASPSDFSVNKSPQDVGVTFASVWQGPQNVTQGWNGISINIDIDVAATASPSNP